MKNVDRHLNSNQKPKRGKAGLYKNGIEVNGYFMCRQCGEMKPGHELAEISNQKYRQYCIHCAGSNGYKVCPSCGKFRHPDRQCSCIDIKSKVPEKNQYNYQANWKPFKHNENDVILFGIELEIEFNGKPFTDAMEVHNKPWVIFKHDGSISGGGAGGFELVTMPLGWNWMQHNRSEFDAIFNLAKLGMKSKCTNTCGMHVHISKKVFSTYHLYKFYQFHYLNQDFLHDMSGRSWTNLERWASITDATSGDIKYQSKAKTGRDRHVAVNLVNPETVEIRIFRGTLAPKQFWRNLEFVKSVYDYTRYANLRNISSIEEFKHYISENKKQYPNLNEYLSTDLKGRILCVS